MNNSKNLPLDWSRMPTTTAAQSRTQLFQPTRTPKFLTRSISTRWGEGTVTGKIGQPHADVLESIFRCAHQCRGIKPDAGNDDKFGAIEILVDPHALRVMAAGKEGSRMSYSQLNDVKNDLMRVLIDLKGNRFNPIDSGSILDVVKKSKKEAPTRPGAIKANNETRFYWYVKVSAKFVNFMAGDLLYFRDPRDIIRMRSGMSQAIARHIVTHDQQPTGGWIIDNLIKVVGGEGDIKNHRVSVKKDADGFTKLRISIEGDRMFRLG